MRQLCLFAFALTLLVVLLGAYTRLTDAGLGCPDWPGCYGFNYVPESASEQQLAASRFPDKPLDLAKAGNEMLHRYAAGSLGMIILVLALCSLQARHRAYCTGAWALLALVILQATLGMLTVTLNLLPFIVLGHLLGGFSILALLFLLLLRARSRAAQYGDPRSRLHTLQHSHQHSQQQLHLQYGRQLLALWWVALLVLIIQIALGGWTAANYAALACVELPVCQGDWLSQWQWSAFHPHGMPAASYQYGVLSSDERITIHVAHRLWAMVTAVVLCTLAWRCYQVRELQHWGAWLALAVVMQLALGVANVWWHLPLPLAVGHNAGAAFLLLIVTGTGDQLCRAREAIWRETRYLSAIKQ
ncbi:COX15/CtaA family protein [Oceanisphaera sp. IT1-181]|uniref:COX15/CtaA family protein n=1 Tax=Oceanisphaera sp. IT1-181 TaxID=3081199 RepID=UPI0029CA540B|nr:COX15/CtaA family protein [Oceanisphaera sp. IT1-181]